MEIHGIKEFLDLFEKMFIVLLTSLVNVSSHTIHVSLSNQNFKIQLTIINIRPIEYNPFVVKLDEFCWKL